MQVRKVIVKEGVTSIGNEAFEECVYLTSVSLPSTLKSIGILSFSSIGASKVTIPNSVETMGAAAFSECRNMTTLTLSTSLKKIPSNAFYACKSLKTLNIPNSVTAIGVDAFVRCDAMVYVYVPKGVKSLNNTGLGSYCKALTFYGYKDSAVQSYAKSLNRPFVSLEEGIKKGLSASKFTYNGNVQQPKVYIKDLSGIVIPATEYTITWPSGCQNAGSYVIKIDFISLQRQAQIIIKPAKRLPLWSIQRKWLSKEWPVQQNRRSQQVGQRQVL